MAGTAVVLLQLGTPEAPTPEAVGPYLLEFLSDRHVIRRHPCVWQPILRLFVVPRRKHVSAANYARIWHPEYGSPLLHWTRRQAEELQRRLGSRVVFAMSYGRPSIREVATGLMTDGVERVVVVPLFPQYSDTTSGSVLETFRQAFQGEIDEIRSFPDHPAYLAALCARLDETLEGIDAPERILVSFHGIPKAYADSGDPYPGECARTFAALQQKLPHHALECVFQSRFGPTEWLRPYLIDRVRELAAVGIHRVLVLQPGFAADCLETLDEVDREVRHAFVEAGGREFSRVPCPNDHPRWIDALEMLVRERLSRTHI